MRDIRGRIRQAVAASIAIAATVTVLGEGQEPADVAGEWALEVNTEAAGTTTPRVTLRQDGTSLTGRYSSATLGPADVTGTVSGHNVTFSFTADVQGQILDVTYDLTLREDDTLTGAIDLGGFGTGSVTGRRR